MNYRAIYNRLIDRARGRVLDGYSEQHHVLPRCCGGGDEPENLVRLTPEEHYLAHQLLVKIHPDEPKLVYSVVYMTGNNDKCQRPNNKLYGWIKRRLAVVAAARMTGNIMSEETKAKLSAANKGQKKTEAWYAAVVGKPGRKRTPEQCARLSAARKGRKRKPHSAETKAKMSAASKGKAKSAEHCAALSVAKMGKAHPHAPECEQKRIEAVRLSVATRDESYKQTDEYRQLQSERTKASWQKRKLLALAATKS